MAALITNTRAAFHDTSFAGPPYFVISSIIELLNLEGIPYSYQPCSFSSQLIICLFKSLKSYILFLFQPVLVYMSKVDGKFNFSPISVNFLTEIAKVIFAVVMLLFQVRF